MAIENSIEGFYDAHGNPCSLERLCQGEPGWAASRIREERAQFAELKNALAFAEQERQALRAEVDGLQSQCEVLRQAACIAAELKLSALSPGAPEPSKPEDR